MYNIKIQCLHLCSSGKILNETIQQAKKQGGSQQFV